jgi:hypothetical protein
MKPSWSTKSHFGEYVNRSRPPLQFTGMPKREQSSSAKLDEERKRREAEELESFERRAEWWRLHYGVPAQEADERTREAIDEVERMPDSDGPSGQS